jgi:recombination protein RecR
MALTPLVQQLMQSLRCLPGVGPKTASRMAIYLLQHDRLGAKRLIASLDAALDRVGYCESCRMLSETPRCPICENVNRDPSLLCVVESPADVMAIEISQKFKGRYFVLMGHLSPLDNMGPEDIGADMLEKRFQLNEIREVIFATNPTVEGEATAHYLAELARLYQIKTSRIALGVPMGMDLEYADPGTLAHALMGRTVYE